MPYAATDFSAFAAKYDQHLPRLQPVSDGLLTHLPPVEDGGLVLDIGTGTGEPALTIARRSPLVQVLGIDNAPTMVEVARHKAAAEGLSNVRFAVVDAEQLDLPSASADAVVSRLGLLLFGDPVRQVNEMARVLVPGGVFSIATWDRASLNIFQELTLRVLAEVLPADQLPDVGWMDALAVTGRRETWLSESGLDPVHSELHSWTHVDPDLDHVWQFFLTGPMGPVFAGLGAEETLRAHEFLSQAAADLRMLDGSYQIPMACRLLWGQRAE